MDQGARVPEGRFQGRIAHLVHESRVPWLVEGYSVANWLPVLASLAFVVLAYQLAAAACWASSRASSPLLRRSRSCSRSRPRPFFGRRSTRESCRLC
jgi:hypothetical protein